MDTEKQRQCRRDDARLTESGNARSEQLNTRGAYRVTNQQSLACLSGSERRRPGWFLDMNIRLVLSLFVVTIGENNLPNFLFIYMYEWTTSRNRSVC